MQLSTLVWLGEVSPSLSNVFFVLAGVISCWLYIKFLWNEKPKNLNFLVIIVVSLMIISALLPSKVTVYAMLAASVAQKAYEDPANQQVVAKIYKLANVMLDAEIEKQVQKASK